MENEEEITCNTCGDIMWYNEQEGIYECTNPECTRYNNRISNEWTDELISLETAMLANKKEYPFGSVISPITQSLLQKWLREQHSIIVLIDTFLGNFVCKINNVIVTNNKTGDILKFTKYEDALEAGLVEGLNRI